MKHRHPMPFGTELARPGGVHFRLWAPKAQRVELEWRKGTAAAAEQELPMQPSGDGWHELSVPQAGAGTRYAFRIHDGSDDEGMLVPDPASRCNPDDVHAESEVLDPEAYDWCDDAWQGRPWHEAVAYELHVGCFTPEGSFAAATRRLPELAALGITAIELMPVADFPGARGWGYDGVLHFAPDASYGRPDELKALVDQAHALGMMVLLDVVYNHFGPDGNYLHAYCPPFFNEARHTPWGAAINFDAAGCKSVREFFVHNALFWVEEYRFDGLRLDAVHAIHDRSATHIACEIGAALRQGPGRERRVHLVLENDRNEAHKLARDAGGRVQCADAQWNDDFHHGVHVLLTGEADGYYAGFADAPAGHIARSLAEGFAFQGQGQPPRGEPSMHLPSNAFVAFMQNHDQVGNRAFGERINELADARRLDAAYACLLLAPHVPMLFMGEEFAASTPFLYFCDFGPGLAEAVTRGRREEFKRFAVFRDQAARERIPDPNSESSFAASKLRWDERAAPGHAERLALVRRLLELRHRELVPHLGAQRQGGSWHCDGAVIRVEWSLGDETTWQLLANLGDETAWAQPARAGTTIYTMHVADDAGLLRLEPGAVLVTRGARSGA